MRLLLRVIPLLLLTLLGGARPAGVWAQARPKAPAPIAAAAPKTGQPLDLNTATAAELKTLPGIGDAYAKRIVDARPYSAKNQLVTRGILPQGTYEKIKEQVVAHRAPKA